MNQALRFLADMNVSPLTVESLQATNWGIVRVSTLLSPTATDSAILELARQQDRVIITHDLDFSALLALSGYDRPSLITLRLRNTDPDLVTERLREILPRIETALLQGSAVTVEDKNLRVRKLPVVPNR